VASRERGATECSDLFGLDLLSQAVASRVSSALAGLTSGFGMGPGVPLPLQRPKRLLFTE